MHGEATPPPPSVGGASTFSHFASIESSEVLRAATEDLLKIFQLEVNFKIFFHLVLILYIIIQNESLLKGRVQLIEVPAESLLGLEGDLESCVYFIASGRLRVFRHTSEADSATDAQVN